MGGDEVHEKIRGPFGVVFPDIHALISPETENTVQGAIPLIITPQLSLLHKAGNLSVLILFIFYISVSNA